MVTHVQFKALEPEYPSTLSPRIIQGLLREDVGFRGLVSTDCMEMKAVTDRYGPGESTVLAALAGANIIFFSHTRELQEAAYDALLEAARSGRLPLEKIDFAVEKIQEIKERFPVADPPPLDVIRRPEHLSVVVKAARAGTVLLHSEAGVLPLGRDDSRRVALIEFASHLDTEALEQSGLTGFASLLQEQVLNVESVGLDPGAPSEGTLNRANSLVSSADLVIVATRNAHLNPRQRELAQQFLDSVRRSILLCLRNPYDAGVLTGAETVLCTCGDGAPSLAAAVGALVGCFTPTAELPVPLTMG
jgi:beta-N-acetylhexosaminidase